MEQGAVKPRSAQVTKRADRCPSRSSKELLNARKAVIPA